MKDITWKCCKPWPSTIFRMPGYKNNEWSNIMLVYMKYYILEQCQAKKWDSELTFVSNQYWDHQPIDSDDTSHNNGNDRLHDEVRSHDTHSCNTSATLCSAIGSTQGYGNQTKRRGEDVDDELQVVPCHKTKQTSQQTWNPPKIYAHILRQTTTTLPRLLKESCTVNR